MTDADLIDVMHYLCGDAPFFGGYVAWVAFFAQAVPGVRRVKVELRAHGRAPQAFVEVNEDFEGLLLGTTMRTVHERLLLFTTIHSGYHHDATLAGVDGVPAFVVTQAWGLPPPDKQHLQRLETLATAFDYEWKSFAELFERSPSTALLGLFERILAQAERVR